MGEKLDSAQHEKLGMDSKTIGDSLGKMLNSRDAFSSAEKAEAASRIVGYIRELESQLETLASQNEELAGKVERLRVRDIVQEPPEKGQEILAYGPGHRGMEGWQVKIYTARMLDHDFVKWFPIAALDP